MAIRTIILLILLVLSNHIIAQEEQSDSIQLEEATVVAEKSTIEYKLDKKVFNVGKDILSNGGSALDVLNNVPSVSTDIEGNVLLRGNPAVRILINGKPSVLTSNGGLEQLNASEIEKVEVITNPSAKYDAEGTAGIVNIILKKNKKAGFSSSLTGTIGTPENTGISANVNFKTNKFNLFSDIGYRERTFLGDGKLFRTNFNGNSISSIIDETIDAERSSKTFNLYFGSDYYWNDLNTSTLSYYYRNNDRENTIQYDFRFLNENLAVDSLLSNTETYTEPQEFNRLEVNHEKKFKKKGQKLTFDAQYDWWNDDENELVRENNLTLGTSNTLQSRDIESSKDFLFQSDYMHPINDHSNLEIGLKGEIREIDSDYTVWDNNVLIDSLDNVLNYKERIYGVYAQYGNKKNKFQYLLGLRVEHSDTESTDEKDKFNTDKNYTDLFPTAHLTYNFGNKTNLQASYSRRIRRPSFFFLNPFGGIADRRNIRIGNPDLNPMYTNSYEIAFLQRWKKWTVNPSVYYQYTTELFETQVTQNEDGIVISQVINSGTENRYGAELAVQYSPFKWWRIAGEINYFRFEQVGIFNVEDDAWSSRINSTVKTSGWNVQASYNYQSGRDGGQTSTKPIYWADLGISKDLWKDKVTITGNIDNIFDTRTRERTVTGTNYTVESSSKFYGRRYGLSLTYRFNRSKKDRNRTGG